MLDIFYAFVFHVNVYSVSSTFLFLYDETRLISKHFFFLKKTKFFDLFDFMRTVQVAINIYWCTSTFKQPFPSFRIAYKITYHTKQSRRYHQILNIYGNRKDLFFHLWIFSSQFALILTKQKNIFQPTIKVIGINYKFLLLVDGNN